MKFKEILKELRNESEMTQRQLAGKLNMTESAVRHWESGRSEPNLDALCALAKIFNVTVGQLLGVEEY